MKNIENIDGKPLEFLINYYDKKGLEFKITVTPEKSNLEKCLILIVAALLNLLVFKFNIASVQYCSCAFIIIAFFIYKLINDIRYESLLIIPLVGCQITRKHNIGSYIKFVLWDDIQNIFINEVITEQKILFVLTILTEDRLIPLFMDIKPRLNCLEKMYQELDYILEDCVFYISKESKKSL